MKLFKFQEDCIGEIREKFKSNKTVCLGWYTGAGKTNVFIEFMKRELERNPNLKFAVSTYFTREIRDQVSERCHSLGLGPVTQMITGKGELSPSARVFVFNPQAVINWIDKTTQFDYFIIDESHAGTDEHCTMLRAIRKKTCSEKTRTLLVSATPWDTLLLKEFKDAVVLKRPLDQGLEDGLITDFKFHAEEAQITFTKKDFGRSGDLIRRSGVSELAILKSACSAKMHYIKAKYKKELGEKVLVICPPGNLGEIARSLAEEFNGLPFLMGRGGRNKSYFIETKDNLDKFKSDDTQFLFVIHKCSVGFDMQNLSSVIDLTMSRNIRVLAQRVGRVARKNKEMKKNYFYVYDKSLMKNKLEWLLLTMTDFCLGSYDGWSTKTVQYRGIDVRKERGKIFPDSFTLKEIVKILREPGNIENRERLSFVTYTRPRKWTTETAMAEARKYSSRTELWEKLPTVYKWLRLNDKAAMDAHFPLKVRLGKWNAETVEALMKSQSGKMERNKFMKDHGGIEHWGKKNKVLYNKLQDKYFPRKLTPRYTEAVVMDLLRNCASWRSIRYFGGLRQWLHRHGGEAHWKKVWMELVPRDGRATDKDERGKHWALKRETRKAKHIRWQALAQESRRKRTAS